MKKLLFLVIVALGMLACNEPSIPIDNGVLPGKFSVSASQQVRFSKGNLQYQASTQTWQFASKQYEIIGSLNSNIADNYDGWIDLFGWGTCINPTLSSIDINDYTTSLDFGVNAISNGGNKGNLWRTLTNDEWEYLLKTRENASQKYYMASVAGVFGIIILPDVYEGTPINFDHNEWENNTISAIKWHIYEAHGAVFLPAAGYRWGTDVSFVGESGCYWTSTRDASGGSHYLFFYSGDIVTYSDDGTTRPLGQAVRLVRLVSK